MRLGESGRGRAEIVTGSVSFILVIAEQRKVFVEKGGQAAGTEDRPPAMELNHSSALHSHVQVKDNTR